MGVPSNSSREGYGLGLSIVQRLVKLLGLELQVRSEVGKGTVFSLAVRAGTARLAPTAAAPRAAYHLANGETGTAVIAALRAVLRRDLKAVLITGDTSAAVKDLVCDPLMRIASKPVRGDELLALKRGLLAA